MSDNRRKVQHSNVTEYQFTLESGEKINILESDLEDLQAQIDSILDPWTTELDPLGEWVTVH